MTRPLVTFALLTYNQEGLVHSAIQAALAQTYSPLQIIISDDASRDATYEVIEREVAGYDGPHSIVLNRNPHNLGISSHINKVMELAQGELIVAAAGDDISLNDRVEKLVTAWAGTGYKVDSLHSAVRRMMVDGEELDIWMSPDYQGATPAEFIRKNIIVGASHAWTKRLFDHFGPLDRQLVREDRVIGFRASIAGGVHYIDEPLVRYRLGGVSNNNFDTLEMPVVDSLRDNYLKLLDLLQNYKDYMLVTNPEFSVLDLLRTEIQRRMSYQLLALSPSPRGRLKFLPKIVQFNGIFLKGLLRGYRARRC